MLPKTQTIDKITFEFVADDPSFVRALYGSWDDFVDRRVQRVAGEVFARHDRPDEHLTIDFLELDLGAFACGDFYEEFPRRFGERLDAVFWQLQHASFSTEVRATKVSLADDAYTLLTQFLRHGWIDALQLARYGDLTALFLWVVEHSGVRLIAFLRSYGHYTGLRRRVAQQFDDRALEAGVRLLLPEGGDFICSYVRFLHTRYPRLERPVLNQTNYRYAVWKVVYAYLLSGRSSHFDRKSFLRRTLESLASKLNVSFGSLIESLVDEAHLTANGWAPLPELLAVLHEILFEHRAHEIHRTPFDVTEFYRFLAQWWKQAGCSGTTSVWTRRLAHILSHWDSCRALIRLLDEQEIVRLVPLVAPEQSAFVRSYASCLERSKERGAFEGRTAGAFSKFKWVVIFPILLEHRTVGFNRRTFVGQTLARIAAHYNLLLSDVLRLLLSNEALYSIDCELADMFRSLLPQAQEPTASVQRQSDVAEWLRRTATESAFVLEYGQMLIASLARRTAVTEHGVWKIALEVLSQNSGSGFLRRSFAHRMLVLLAEHCALYYAELLGLVRRYGSTVGASQSVLGVVDELCRSQERLWFHYALASSSAPAKEQLLRDLRPQTAPFMIDFFRLIEQTEQLRVCCSQLQRDKWAFIFRWLDAKGRAAFDRRSFVRAMLDRICRRYRIDRSALQAALYASANQAHTSVDRRDLPLPPVRAVDAPMPETALFVGNAGLVLLSPFFDPLFSAAGLIDPKQGLDKISAAFLMQYVVCGQQQMNYGEHELLLNRLLAGLPPGESLPRQYELPDAQAELADSMIRSALAKCKRIEGSSIELFRETFLQRSGKIERSPERILVTVESKTYDMLLDSIPWSYSYIKYPWTEQRIEVRWR